MVGRWIVTSCLLLACGGKSTRDGPENVRARGSISSREAFEAIRAKLPEGARVLELRSSPAGTLGVDGRDELWLANSIVDEAGLRGWGARVEPGVTSLDVELGAIEVPRCSSAGLADVDSAVVVSEALATVRTFSALSLGSSDRVYIDYWQQAPCTVVATSMAFTRTGHMVQVNHRGADWSFYHFAHYDDAGALRELCGPCDSGLVADCSDCLRLMP